MTKYIFVCLLLLSNSVYPQTLNRLKIQSTILGDTILIKEIRNMIIKEINSNDPEQLFKNGYGYIELHTNAYYNSDTVYHYHISPSFKKFRKTNNDREYSLFYTHIDKRLILIYFDVFDSNIINPVFSLNSKYKIIKLISNNLEKNRKNIFYDLSGKQIFKEKHFYLNRLRFDSGIYLYVMKDGSYKIQKQEDNK